MKKLNVLTKGILAGILIGLAGSIYLSVENNILGAFLFSFGLLMICAAGYNLYTGKVGYIIDNKKGYMIDVLLMILGNLLGVSLISLLISLAGLTNISEHAHLVSAKYVDHHWYEMLGLSILCGMMMYLGVEGYKRIKNDIAKTLLVIFAVMIFILAGFEHSIAFAFYYIASPKAEMIYLYAFIIMLIGNGLGAVIINALEKLSKLK